MWRAAYCAVLGAGLARSACTDTQLWLLLETLSHTRNQSPAPDGQPHLQEEEEEEEERVCLLENKIVHSKIMNRLMH